MLGHDKQWWGFSFLESDTTMTSDERLEVLVAATEMYLNNETERRVKGENYEGIINTSGKYKLMGDFGGKEYKARIEVGDHKANLSFLVKEFLDPSRN